MENYSQSVQFSMDRIKASAQELAADFLKSDLLKGVIEFGNTAVQTFDKLVIKGNALLPLISGIGGAFYAFKNKDNGRDKPSPKWKMPLYHSIFNYRGSVSNGVGTGRTEQNHRYGAIA